MGSEMCIRDRAFFGGVVGNITALVAELGSSGLPGLVAVGIILWLFQR